MWGTPNSSRRISIFSAANRVKDTSSKTADFMEAQYNSTTPDKRACNACPSLLHYYLESGGQSSDRNGGSMNKPYRPILCGALLIIAGHSLFAQVAPPLTCNASAPGPPV